MGETTCSECGGTLVYSARGKGACGPCRREEGVAWCVARLREWARQADRGKTDAACAAAADALRAAAGALRAEADTFRRFGR